MKRRRALLFTLTIVLALCAASGWWLHKERRQYALNRQMIKALVKGDIKQALLLVNAGADPNTRIEPQSAPSLKLLLNQWLHHAPSADYSPTALMLACGISWQLAIDKSLPIIYLEEDFPLLQAMLEHGGARIADSWSRSQPTQRRGTDPASNRSTKEAS